MRVYEAIVKGLESVGVDAAFGGAGENAAGLMLALKHSEQIRPVITRHEQAASFMACGYAMFTDRLGFCFATAGPGAFNLFSGLAVAMSDSYPVLAVSGYASLEWRGRGSLNETSGLNRTPDSHAMFQATTKQSWLLTDIDDTCDVLEEAVNVALEGRPGPVHIHVPENLTHHGVEVRNYHDVRLDVRPVTPDPAACRGGRGGARGRDRPPAQGRGAGRLRRHPQRRRAGDPAPHRALPDPAADDARREGHRRGVAPAVRRRVLRQRPQGGVEGVPRRRRRALHRQLAEPARDLQLPRRPVRRPQADPRQHLRRRDRQGLQGRPRDRRGRPPRRRRADRGARAEGRRRAARRGREPRLRGQARPAPDRVDPPRPAGAGDRAHAAAAGHPAGRRRRAPGLPRLLRRARGGPELPQGRHLRSRWRGTSTARWA